VPVDVPVAAPDDLAPVAPAPRHAVSLAGLLLTSAAPGSPEAAAAAEARLAVRDALSDVPAADRLLVELRVFHGWSTEEIAQLAAGSVDEVAERLEAVLDRLGLDHAAVLPVPSAEPATAAAAELAGEEEVVA
jgi:DNA-directed RNA polymerase specialized sigma24 family protein